MNQRNLDRLFSASSLVWIGLLLVLLLNFSIRWHLREMPLERDEGEYAYAGQLIQQGIPPYQIAWNMKFPGVYYAYAALMSVFGQSSAGIHTGIILVTSLSVVLVFLIGRRWLGGLGGLMAAALFTLLTAVPFTFGLAGHATHFVVLFVCLGTFALLLAKDKRPLLWTAVAGMAFGTAIVMKQHAFVFALAALGWQLWEAFQKREKFLTRSAIFIAAVAVPLVVMVITMAMAGVWSRFNLWTIQYARDYVSLFPLGSVPSQFMNGFAPILDCGIWVWLLGLAGIVMVLFRRWRQGPVLPAAGLLLAGLVATAPGFYFRGHYFLMALPGLALLDAALLVAFAGWLKKKSPPRIVSLLPAIFFVVIAGDLLVRNAGTWFQLSPTEVNQKIYAVNPFGASPVIARYIADHSAPGDTVAVLGSEPEIFFLSHRHSASGYIYVYPLTEPQPLAPVMRQEFFQEIETAKPAFVVRVNLLPSWCSVVIPRETSQALDGVQKWWTDYSTNYHLAGIVDIETNRPVDFFWDQDLSQRTNTDPPSISIYRRN